MQAEAHTGCVLKAITALLVGTAGVRTASLAEGMVLIKSTRYFCKNGTAKTCALQRIPFFCALPSGSRRNRVGKQDRIFINMMIVAFNMRTRASYVCVICMCVDTYIHTHTQASTQ